MVCFVLVFADFGVFWVLVLLDLVLASFRGLLVSGRFAELRVFLVLGIC